MVQEMIYTKELQGPIATGIATAGTLLITTKIHDTIIDNVAKNLIPRSEAAYVITAAQMGPSSTYDLNLENENTMDIREIAEGGDIFLDSPIYSTTQVVPKKYGVGLRITKEMEEDAKWNMMDRGLSTAGKRFAENETSLILDVLQGTTGGTVSGGAALTIANITEAMNNIEDDDYEPTSFLIGTEVLRDLRELDTFVEANKVGNTDMLQKGFLGVIYGMNVMKFSGKASSATSTFPKYAYVYDKNHAYVIVEKRPVTIEHFSIPTHDMRGASITQRIAVKILRANASSKISTS